MLNTIDFVKKTYLVNISPNEFTKKKKHLIMNKLHYCIFFVYIIDDDGS